MGATVKVTTENGETSYEFDKASDGVDFKKDITKEFKKLNNKKNGITIKKTKDIKPKVKEKKRYYNDKEIW